MAMGNNRTLTDRGELTWLLEAWLNDKSILASTRGFLGVGAKGQRSGLGDAQIANWRRSGSRKTGRKGALGLPDTFVEGAALYHGACGSRFIDPVVETGIEGGRYFQVFILHEAVDPAKAARLDCTILRCWEGVRAVRGAAWLSHDAVYSTPKAGNGGEPTVEWLAGPEGVERKGNGFVRLGWDVGSDECDYAYAGSFPQSIRNGHTEAVGGVSTIPMSSVHLVVFLPRRIVDAPRDRRSPNNPRGLPFSLRTLATGSSLDLIETYLGVRKRTADKGDYRHLGPWFREGPLAEPFVEDAVRVPECIRGHAWFKAAEAAVSERACEAFVVQIYDPLPFLSYFVVFGEESRDAGPSGESDPHVEDSG